ncbi:MAG: hypothetical protein H6656_14585 [Ardenticatenaceae bacterium]|nr:hypothetical protein [Ardenticatenaceae bacterium]
MEINSQFTIHDSKFTIDENARIQKDGSQWALLSMARPNRLGTPAAAGIFQRHYARLGLAGARYTIPAAQSHVHPDNIDRSQGEMLLLPNFRLRSSTRAAPTPNGYTKSATKSRLDASQRCPAVGVATGDLIRVETEIGYLSIRWVTEACRASWQ